MKIITDISKADFASTPDALNKQPEADNWNVVNATMYEIRECASRTPDEQD